MAANASLRMRPRRVWRALREAAGGFVQPQVSSAARERRDNLVLLAAVAVVAAPHFEHLPWWAASLVLLLWVWRLWLTLSRGSLPGRFAMLPLLAGAAGAVWLQHGTLLGRDAGVTFLLLLMGLKLLEMRARRDVFVVIFLCFFVLLTQFLFSQSLPIAALTVVAALLLFFVLVSVNLVDADQSAGRKARLVGAVFVKSLPLAAAMFVLFPRVSAPLWGLPGDAHSRTGLSDSMSPGSINRLLQSSEIAFRVQFDGTPPPNERLYWRGPVLGHYGGRTWTALRSRSAPPPPLALTADAASAVDYTVTLEPHLRDWLFALEMPALPAGAPLAPRLTDDAQLVASQLITDRIRYRVRSYTRFAMGLNETPASLADWLQLPPGYNPRTLQLAARLRAAAADPTARVDAVLDHFRSGGYRYTLAPPLLGRDAIDEFLFDTRLGFCEHYAAAFVVLMRAMDVPARVVTGYQGGEINPIDGFLTVRQSDAHAWAEVWLAGRGWVRVDPTAVVAPVRLLAGAAEAAREQRVAPLVLDVGRIDWLRRLRFNWEALENAWNQWVLSYSAERQRELLQRLGLDPDWRTLGWLFAAALLALLAVLAAFSLRHRVERDPLAELFDRFRARLAAAGVNVQPSEGPRALAQRLERELAAEALPRAREILHAIERWRYSRSSVSVPPAAVRQLRRALRSFRPRAA
jgi:transglutaminase-like putative cysteine protease